MALITGVDGFVGSHLADLLVREGHEVHGIGRRRRPLPEAELPSAVHWHSLDMLRRRALDPAVAALKPEWVFHLAASSSVAESWQDPARTLMNNVGATANILAALVTMTPMPRVLLVGSSDEYGRAPSARALGEETPLRPLTPYGVSKLAQDMLGLQYHLSHGLPVVRVRPFNHTGPRQPPAFAVASFARQLALIEAGRQPPRLKVGNLWVRRDFTDVRDIVRAYRLAVEFGRAGAVYNIGSGRAVSLREVAKALIGISGRRVSIEVNAARTRPVDAATSTCDARRFRRLTGWRPLISLEETLRDTLEYWRRREAA